jgi:hypothetical protein
MWEGHFGKVTQFFQWEKAVCWKRDDPELPWLFAVFSGCFFRNAAFGRNQTKGEI